MDKLSYDFFVEMCKKEYWDRAYERINTKEGNNPFNMDELYVIKETDQRIDLAKQVCSGEYVWSVPEKLLLAKSGTTKKRVVYMYSPLDRFVLGVLYRALSEYHADKLAKSCFSYKRRVNTANAIHYVKKVKQERPLYGVKLDISAYFNSVSREYLETSLTELFGTNTNLRKTMNDLFMDDTVSYKGTEQTEYKSLIPGCALGSFFANYCLRELDWSFEEKGVVYARYSDDILVFGETEDEVNGYLEEIKEKIKECGLTINEKKYVHFKPEDDVEYLGLKLYKGGVDISDHAKKKMKATIRRWVKAARKEIEMKGKPFDKVAAQLVKRLNWKLYKSYVYDTRKFGWGYYAFRYITVTDSLTELDFYLRDRLRYLKTGKNNKANVKALNDDDFTNLGVLSFYDMFILFNEDFDHYCEVAYLI